MQQTQVDGVPVFWRQGPEPLTATLAFLVGRRDESFVQGGITHLVEHLVMRALGKSHLDTNASVDLGGTFFTATGRPAAVGAFIENVCRTLADLPVEALAVERDILMREGGTVSHPLDCVALGERYGARDAGLAAFGEPALAGLGPGELRAWAARYFVVENAALGLTGPPPEGLRLPLPTGVRNKRVAVTPRDLPWPGWTEGPDGVAVAFEATFSTALMAGLRIALDRATDEIRHGRGHAYELDFVGRSIDPSTERSHVTFWADAAPRQAADVANALLEVLGALAADGPTADELTHDRDGMLAAHEDPRAVEGAVMSRAASHLAGREHLTEEQELVEHRELTPAAVAAALAPVATSALVLLPDGVAFDRPGFTYLPASAIPALHGRRLRRRLGSGAPRGAELVLADEGLTLSLRKGPTTSSMTVRWDDVVGVGTDDGMLVVQGGDGGAILVRAGDWRGGEAAVAAVREHVVPELFFVEPPDEESAVPGARRDR